MARNREVNWQRRLIAAAVLLLLSLAVYIGIRLDLNKGEWASWVQAVGSIFAIIAALLVVNRQIRAQRHIEWERAVNEQIDAFATFIVLARSLIRSINSQAVLIHPSRGETRGLDRTAIDVYLRQFRTIEVATMRHGRAVRAALRIQVCLETAIGYLDRAELMRASGNAQNCGASLNLLRRELRRTGLLLGVLKRSMVVATHPVHGTNPLSLD